MSDELKTVLGFDASGAISTLKELTANLSSFTAGVHKSAAALRAFNKASTGVEQNLSTLSANAKSFAVATGNTASSTNKASTALGSLSKTSSTAVTATNQITKTQQQLGNVIEETAEKNKKSFLSTILSWQAVVRIFAIQYIHQAVSSLTSAFVDAATAAREFEINLAEIQTIGEKYQGDFEGLANQVMAFSEATGQPLKAVTEGTYEILSNQVVGAADTFNLLQTASDFSIAAVTDLGSSVNLLSAVMNSYGMAASDAETVSGKLFRMIDLGRVRGQELGDTIGRVTALSSELGVNFDEVAASLATLTISGIKYNEAYTLITNIELKLIKPTEALRQRFDELGIASSEAGIQAYGFQGFLTKITEGSNATATELGELYSRVRAIRGALGLTGQSAERYISYLQQIKEASASTLEKSKALVFNTNAKQVEIELNKVSVAFTKIGRDITAYSLTFFKFFGGAPAAIGAMTKALVVATATWYVASKVIKGTFQSWVTGFATAQIAANKTAQALGILTFQVTGLRGIFLNATNALKSLMKSPLTWAAIAFAAVAALQAVYNRASAAAKAADDEIIKSTEARHKANLVAVRAEIEAAQEGASKQLSVLQQYLQDRAKLYNEMISTTGQLEEIQFNSLKDQLKESGTAANAFFDSIIMRAKDADSTVIPINFTFNKYAVTSAFDDLISKTKDLHGALKPINEALKDLFFEFKDFNFERSLRSLSEAEQIKKRIAESQRLQQQSIAAFRQGNTELAKDYSTQAKEQAKTALSSADQIKNVDLVRKAEDNVRNSLRQQADIQKALGQQIINRGKLAKQESASIQQSKTYLNSLIDTYTAQRKKMEQMDKDAAGGLINLDPEQRAKAEAELKQIAKLIDEELTNIKGKGGLAKALGLTEEFRGVSGINFFDPITGQVTTFEKATIASIDRIEARFQTFAASASKSMQPIIDSLVGAGTPFEQQNRLATLGQQLGDYSTAQKTVGEEQERINATLEREGTIRDRLRAELEKTKFVTPIDFDSSALITDLDNRVAKLFESMRSGQTDTVEFAQQLKDLSAIADSFGEARGKKGLFSGYLSGLLEGDESSVLRELIGLATEASEAQGRIGKETEKMDVGSTAMSRLKQFEGAIKSWETKNITSSQNVGSALNNNIASGASAGAGAVNAAAQSMIGALQAVSAQAVATAQAIAQASAQTSTGKQLGGLLYRASGGFTRGTDKIPAMLSPGEFIANPKASRQFYTQLVAMNAGMRPSFKSNGGPVVNVGDINVNMSGTNNNRQDALNVATVIRREIRRNTLKLS
jgi:TP901 family phage tail tape measure protein